MRLKYAFETVDLGDEIIAVPVGEGARLVKGVLKLNRAGMEILELLKEDRTVDELAAVLSGRYENDPAEIADFVRKAVDDLDRTGLLQE